MKWGPSFVAANTEMLNWVVGFNLFPFEHTFVLNHLSPHRHQKVNGGFLLMRGLVD
jgi:hypothetical protein